MCTEMDLINETLPVIKHWSRFLFIDSDDDLDKALLLVESLIDRKDDGETHFTPVINSLADAMEKYKTKYPVGEYTGVEMLKFLMEQNNHRQSSQYSSTTYRAGFWLR